MDLPALDVVGPALGGAAVPELQQREAGRMSVMVMQMDQAVLALQGALAARRLYGAGHAVAARQASAAHEALARLLGLHPVLRLVRVDQSVLFEDRELPSCVHLADVLLPALTGHGVEWLEFRAGLDAPELVRFLEQLDRDAGDAGPPPAGAAHVRVGRIGRPDAASLTAGSTTAAGGVSATAVISGLDQSEQAEQLRQVWDKLRKGNGGGPGARPDERLAELVESIRLAVAVGADVCKQLAEVKSHDEYTFVHTVNVGILSAALGEAVGMNSDQVFSLIMAALLHDVGKQHTPLAILNKAGKLEDAERKRMEQHTIDGAALLLARRGVPDVAPIVAFEHHANLDGTGYPFLGRNARPHLASQIVHVADVFDALRTNRPYRAAMEESKVRAILLEGAGKAFDPALVDVFLNRVIQLPGAREGGARILSPGTTRLRAG
jgi:putative nucleotidyltransferase with HDIG domain